MNLNQIYQLKIEDIDDEQSKQEICSTLINSNIENIPKKYLRKYSEICLYILVFQNEKIKSLEEKVDYLSNIQEDEKDDSYNEKISNENERLMKLVNRLETEKISFGNKIRELNEEIAVLQKRLHEVTASTESDKDSSDPLSELDRQEELLKNISTKNKHIKKLIRDIEILQIQNIDQSKVIIEKDNLIQQLNHEIDSIKNQLFQEKEHTKELDDIIKKMAEEISRLEGNVTYLEDERDKNDQELKEFIDKLEQKARIWRTIIDDKENQLESLRKKYEELNLQNCDGSVVYESNNVQVKELVEALQERDLIIKELEEKLKIMAEEMIESTRLMNKISNEREEEKQQKCKKERSCCKEMEESLLSANYRCKELSEILESVEEDNLLKSKQALEAISALEAYQKGEDGLPQALRKISQLEQKLNSRDKQIKALVMEVNSLHEIAQENSILRKKLNIPDDAIISARNLIAKEKNKTKMLERLNLKLRASEEMRLQLKLEKNELKNEIFDLKKKLQQSSAAGIQDPKQKVVVMDSESQKSVIYCDNCLRNIQTTPNRDEVIQDIVKEWEMKYTGVIEENENLRAGMHEILEKIREYDASSDHITIDCKILEKLLHALDARSISGWYHPAMRMQNELIAVKEREYALREKVCLIEKSMPDKIVERIKDIDHVRRKEDNEIIEAIKNVEQKEEKFEDLRDDKDEEHKTELTAEDEEDSILVEKSTKEVEDGNENLYPVIVKMDTENTSVKNQYLMLLEKYRNCLMELEQMRCYKTQFEMLNTKLEALEEEEITKYCGKLVNEINEKEIELKILDNKYKFLLEDYDRTLTDYKNSEMNSATIIANLKKQLNAKRHEIDNLKLQESQINEKRNKIDIDQEDLILIKKENIQLRIQLAKIIKWLSEDESEFMKKIKEIDNETDKFMNYGIVKDNLQLDYITLNEYETIKSELQKIKDEHDKLKLKNTQIEDLLSIAQEQVKSQQKLLSEITDNHIELRHLVADLQSKSEDKFLLSKMNTDLSLAKREINALKSEKENLLHDVTEMRKQLQEKEILIEELSKSYDSKLENNNLKLKFLKKSVFLVYKEYCKYTPLILLVNFTSFCSDIIHKSKIIDNEKSGFFEFIKQFEESLQRKISEYTKENFSKDLIKLIKFETKCEFYEKQLNICYEKMNNFQDEINQLKLMAVTNEENWKTIKVLFDDTEQEQNNETEGRIQEQQNVTDIRKFSISIQTECDVRDVAVNTEKSEKEIIEGESSGPSPSPPPKPAPRKPQSSENDKITNEKSSQSVLPSNNDDDVEESMNFIYVQNQLKQAMNLASKRSALLLEAESRLAEAQSRIKEMEKIIENKNQQLKQQELQKNSSSNDEKAYQRNSNLIESTINSLQSLLSEKDRHLIHYQELLKNEREQYNKCCNIYETEIMNMKKSLNELNSNIKVKDNEIVELKTKIKTIEDNQIFIEKMSSIKLDDSNSDGSIHNDFNNLKKPSSDRNDALHDNEGEVYEISDEKIEEMFLDESKDSVVKPELTLPPAEDDLSHRINNDLKAYKQLQIQFRDIKSRETFWEKSLRAKDEEIMILKEKLTFCQEKEKIDSNNAEIEQLRILLEEKDKHINDLMETLSNFHDDQQRFISETSLYSVDQVSQLGADLSRCETTNKILNTQIEALRRQVTVLTQREKQARDLANSLKTQLIKRPVISIKSELISRSKNEQLQKRIGQLEMELDDAKKEIQKQQNLIEAKRTKNLSDLNLWEKQKKWQQNAEKLKTKLKETETELEKTNSLLAAARTAITRLEKEKNSLELKLRVNKCCRAPSCPNLLMTKYRSSESPEMWTPMTERSSPTRKYTETPDVSTEFIDSLKARIDAQQRRIVSLELERKGSNVLTLELEKLQEKISSLEAQNIRLEAKCLQLQLDNDMLRQGNEYERLQKRIRHLENYILALKEELSQAESEKSPPVQKSGRTNALYNNGDAEQTILALRRIIEKLKVENKNLKDGVTNSNSQRDMKIGESATEISKFQNLYAEALDKISSLQIELQLKKNYCADCKKKLSNNYELNEEGGGDLANELKLVKENLEQKTQLLYKAKILLTRAAAKEKNSREQIDSLKRKCSELQNVPVIEEISE